MSPTMPLAECQYWIFDMDGTLTLPVHDFVAIRQALDIPADVPILEYIDNLPPTRARCLHHKLDHLEMQLAHQAVAQPGVGAVLASLAGRGKKLGILTRNSERIAEVTLQACGLRGYFCHQTIIGRETCRPKPLPHGIEHLLDYWAADRQQTVMVGDFLYDIQAGYRAGVTTVHFDARQQFLWPEFTDYKIARMADLPTLFGMSNRFESMA